ncbi:hypothetical protein ACFYUV_10205 [Nonomuraea sp. NPDC003560]|uniref:hypothetical protein n=1 Tax=Nonomuraea sp. NPDC003560 TaxID=3364341 RepID=UPI0036CC339F
MTVIISRLLPAIVLGLTLLVPASAQAAGDCSTPDCLLKVTSKSDANVSDGLKAADLQDAYKLPSSWLGGGQTLAVVVPYGHPGAERDLNEYRKGNDLPLCDEMFPCFRHVDQRGGTTRPPTHNGYALHTAAGLDLGSAACPNCKLLLVEADDETPASIGAAVDQAVVQGADAVSVMTGFYEYAGQRADAAHYDHPGVPIVAGGGSGFGNGVGRQMVPAAYGSVIAVGATTLWRDPGNARGWSEMASSGSGSGCSVYEARPAWQPKGQCGAKRTVADVAAVGDARSPVQLYESTSWGGWIGVSGTPISVALIGGVYALGDNGQEIVPGQKLYGSGQYLFDITTGANGSCGGSPLCTARRGHDGPTGMGVPNGIGAF